MSTRSAIKILLAIVIAITLFHLAIITKIIPYEFAWGGRLQSDADMYRFETNALLINLLFGVILLMKGGYIKPLFKQKIIDRILWVYLILFILNTIGNLLAQTNFEKGFAVLTGASVFLIWKILRSKSSV